MPASFLAAQAKGNSASDRDVRRAEGRAQVSQVAEKQKAQKERAEPGVLCLWLLTLPRGSSGSFSDEASRDG